MYYNAPPRLLETTESLVYADLTKPAQIAKGHDQLTKEGLKGHPQAVAAGKMK